MHNITIVLELLKKSVFDKNSVVQLNDAQWYNSMYHKRNQF